MAVVNYTSVGLGRPGGFPSIKKGGHGCPPGALRGNRYARMQSHGAIFTHAFDQFFGSAHNAEAFVALGKLPVVLGVTAAFAIRYHERFLG